MRTKIFYVKTLKAKSVCQYFKMLGVLSVAVILRAIQPSQNLSTLHFPPQCLCSAQHLIRILKTTLCSPSLCFLSTSIQSWTTPALRSHPRALCGCCRKSRLLWGPVCGGPCRILGSFPSMLPSIHTFVFLVPKQLPNTQAFCTHLCLSTHSLGVLPPSRPGQGTLIFLASLTCHTDATGRIRLDLDACDFRVPTSSSQVTLTGMWNANCKSVARGTEVLSHTAQVSPHPTSAS